jgi:hypothetical protein
LTLAPAVQQAWAHPVDPLSFCRKLPFICSFAG